MKGEKVLVVGFGISGAVLSHHLEALGHQVYVADPMQKITTSRVAAGLFNPILIGRRKKTWMAEILFEHFPDFYRLAEQRLNTRFFFPAIIHHLPSDMEEQNDWDMMLADPNFESFFEFSKKQLPSYIHTPFSAIEINKAGWLDIPTFLDASYYTLKNMGRWLSKKIVFDTDLKYVDNQWHLVSENQSFDRVFYCTGEHDRELNEPFAVIPFNPVKGDVIDITTEAKLANDIYHQKVFLIPLSSNTARIGSTYNWNTLDYLPRKEGAEELSQKLESFFKAKYKIIDHKAGIRPAVAGRRPFIGSHTEFKNLYVLNGMGSKGVTLAPYFSEILLNYVYQNQPIPPEVDVQKTFNKRS
jgi:glycine/D-amino acid oxidase-like deaminating enzyme